MFGGLTFLPFGPTSAAGGAEDGIGHERRLADRRGATERQAERGPHLDERIAKVRDEGVVVERRRRDAEALGGGRAPPGGFLGVLY